MSTPATARTVALLSDRIVERLAGLNGAVVALSGGVDSSVVAALAVRALGERALAVTAVSPALATGELDGAASVALTVGINHEAITTNELARAGYRANGPDRCYHCKSELYDNLAAIAQQRGYAAVLSGANADDLGDWRPGLIAAEEHGVLHPLVEFAVDKDHVRLLAAHLGVPNAKKVASPCLASRIPHGTPVDAVTLARVDRAEQALRALGLGPLRVRHYDELGRVELSEDDLARRDLLEPAIIKAITIAGYARVEISTTPFRSGSLTRQFVGNLPLAQVVEHH
jgi:pyridinium-3,5-biscarboxylic acid mononucleotide sulfurtransferase